MNKMMLISLIVIINTFFCQAQNKTGITTEEEYNYMTKGYQIQLTSGLDMKKGYEIGKIISIGDGNYSFNFTPLLRFDNNKVLVGYIVNAHSNVSGRNYYYGLPIGNEELLNRCFTDIKTLDASMTAAFFKAYVRVQTGLF